MAGQGNSTLTGGSAGFGSNSDQPGPGDDTLVTGSGTNAVYGNGGSNTVIIQAPNINKNTVYGGYSDGTADPNADNRLEVLSLPDSDGLSVVPSGLRSFQVMFQQTGQKSVVVANGGSFDDLFLGGASGTNITIGDLSQTTLRNVYINATPDQPVDSLAFHNAFGQLGQSALPLLDHGGLTTLGQKIIGLKALNLFNSYIYHPLAEIDDPKGNTVTVDGSPAADNFVEQLLRDTTTQKFVTQVTVGKLTANVTGMGGEDALFLNGGGGGDQFLVYPASTDRFGIFAEDGGSNASLIVVGTGIAIGTCVISDSAANQLVDSVIFSWRAQFFLPVTYTNVVDFDDSINSVTVRGPGEFAGKPGEAFIANRSAGTTKIIGSEGDDTIDVRGTSSYTLDGGDGSDAYTVHWGLSGDAVTLDDHPFFGAPTLTIDDTANSASVSTDYQVSANNITRVDQDTKRYGNAVLGVKFTNKISFANMAQVTLDIGNGTTVGNQIDVEGTAAGTTTIINAESGINQFSIGRTPNKFSVGQAANNLDLIAGPLTLNQRSSRRQLNLAIRRATTRWYSSHRGRPARHRAQQRCHHLRPNRRIVDQCAGDRHGDRNFVAQQRLFHDRLARDRPR